MVPPIPPSDAFALYLDRTFLSQPHRHPGATTEAALVQLAQERWETESEGTKQLYKLQEAKQRETYEKQRKAYEEYEDNRRQRQGKKGAGLKDGEGDDEDGGGEGDGKAGGSGGSGSGGGFTSINA